MTDYSDKVAKTHVAYITESWVQSAARDLTTGAMFLFLWSVGHFADSAALEWVGVTFGGMFLFLRALAVFKGAMDNRMTPDEAREWLDKRFPTQPDTPTQ